jgi:predicted nucleic acid-binding protein
MRSMFPGHFRPTEADFHELWSECIFAVDANVLLNLYRYSPDTRTALEVALQAVADRLFVPHQAAKEFLKNRLNVTAGQAEEYTKAIRAITDLSAMLANRKKHPFLPEPELPQFTNQVDRLVTQLDAQRTVLLNRLTNDEILQFVEKIFAGKTGEPFSKEQLEAIAVDGELRYKTDVPPGYKDAKKDISDDPYRKFGDLIVWKQLIQHASASNRSVVFITDDKKDDWWIEQSGRTIGPRTELREEFISHVHKNFWMYTVDKFIEEGARANKTKVSEKVIEEILEVRQEVKAERHADADQNRPWRAISRQEMIDRISASLRWAADNSDGFLGLKSFVLNYLSNAGYDHSACFDMIRQLEEDGIIEVYPHQGEGHLRPAKALRFKRPEVPPFNPALAGLKDVMEKLPVNASSNAG